MSAISLARERRAKSIDRGLLPQTRTLRRDERVTLISASSVA
jgi:hypothetical protein